jgi:hypothetical protein
MLNPECNHPTCSDTCRKVKAPKPRKAIAKMSAKRIRVHAAYVKMVADMMKVSDRCELRSPVCTGKRRG